MKNTIAMQLCRRFVREGKESMVMENNTVQPIALRSDRSIFVFIYSDRRSHPFINEISVLLRTSTTDSSSTFANMTNKTLFAVLLIVSIATAAPLHGIDWAQFKSPIEVAEVTPSAAAPHSSDSSLLSPKFLSGPKWDWSKLWASLSPSKDVPTTPEPVETPSVEDKSSVEESGEKSIDFTQHLKEAQEKFSETSAGRALGDLKTVCKPFQDKSYNITQQNIQYAIDQQLAKVDAKILELKENLRKEEDEDNSPFTERLKKKLTDRRKIMKLILKACKKACLKALPVLGQINTAAQVTETIFETLPESAQDQIKDQLLPTGSGRCYVSGLKFDKNENDMAVIERAEKVQKQRRQAVLETRRLIRQRAQSLRNELSRSKGSKRKGRRLLKKKKGRKGSKKGKDQSEADLLVEDIRGDADALRWDDLEKHLE